MILQNHVCRFRDPIDFDADGFTQCLNHQVFARDRMVTQDLCGSCAKWKALSPDPPQGIVWSAMDAPSGTGAEGQRNCLLVLQPRSIARCLRSIDALPVDKVYFRAFTEQQLVRPINDYIQETDYDNYLIVADDVIVTVEAYHVVADLLRRHELATGYCRLSRDSPFVNLTRGPLRLSDGRIPVMEELLAALPSWGRRSRARAWLAGGGRTPHHAQRHGRSVVHRAARPEAVPNCRA